REKEWNRERLSLRGLSRELGVSEWSVARLVQAVCQRCGGRRAATPRRPAGRRRHPGGRGGPAPTRGGSRQPATGHFKKSLGHLGAGAVERYEVITEMKAQPACPYSTVELCSALEVSRERPLRPRAENRRATSSA